MSPPPYPSTFDKTEQSLQSLIQTLYEISVNVYRFDSPPASADILINQITELVQQFQTLESITLPPSSSSTTNPTNLAAAATTTTTTTSSNEEGIQNVMLPKEVIGYVEHGRNPDIYTREFVELVVKHNQLLNGKQRAFREFRDILAEQINVTFPELREDVESVLEATGGSSSSTTTTGGGGSKDVSERGGTAVVVKDDKNGNVRIKAEPMTNGTYAS